MLTVLPPKEGISKCCLVFVSYVNPDGVHWSLSFYYQCLSHKIVSFVSFFHQINARQ